MFHVRQEVPRTGIAQAETGGPCPEPGRYIFRGQFRMGPISVGLSLHSATCNTNSSVGLVRRSLPRFGFRIVLRW